jgi:hypothetical protein
MGYHSVPEQQGGDGQDVFYDLVPGLVGPKVVGGTDDRHPPAAEPDEIPEETTRADGAAHEAPSRRSSRRGWAGDQRHPGQAIRPG